MIPDSYSTGAESGRPVIPPPEPTPRRPNRAWPRRKVLIVAAITVAVIIVAASLLTVAVSLRTGCALGGELGLFNVTSPTTLVNIPDNGSAGEFENALNWTISSGSLTLGGLPSQEPNSGFGTSVGAGGGGLLISVAQPIFAVYSVKNVTSSSPGARPCGQPYVAQVVQPGYCGGFGAAGGGLPDPANDSIEPHIFNESCPYVPEGSGIAGGAYMWFDTAYPSSSPTGSQFVTLDLCGWTTDYTDTVRGSVGFPIALHVPLAGRTIVIHGLLSWESWLVNWATVSYGLPPDWIWRVASIGQFSEGISSLVPPGLLAFERMPC